MNSIYIYNNEFTITNNTNAYNNELWSITRIESTIKDFMVIFNYLLNQIHTKHNYIIAPIKIFIVMITTTDNNNISITNGTNTTININNSCFNKHNDNQWHNTTNSIIRNNKKDLKSTIKFRNNTIIAYTFNIDTICHQFQQIVYHTEPVSLSKLINNWHDLELQLQDLPIMKLINIMFIQSRTISNITPTISNNDTIFNMQHYSNLL